jgi:hypothetical protein
MIVTNERICMILLYGYPLTDTSETWSQVPRCSSPPPVILIVAVPIRPYLLVDELIHADRRAGTMPW